MASSQGPYTLTAGQTLTVPNPTAGGGNPAAAVQLQNASGFVLSVIASGNQYTIQPFTAQTIPLVQDGSPITLQPIGQAVGIVSASLYVVWLLGQGNQPEAPPMADGPLTSAAVFAATSLNANSAVSVNSVTAASNLLPALTGSKFYVVSSVYLASSTIGCYLYINGDTPSQIAALFAGNLSVSFPFGLRCTQLDLGVNGAGACSAGCAYSLN